MLLSGVSMGCVMRLSKALAPVLLCGITSTAVAQDDGDRRRARDFESEIVREVERGIYLKSNIGSTVFFNTHGQTRFDGSGLFSGVVALGIGVGSDIIDRERFSAAIEGQFNQALLNGPRTEELGQFSDLAQGDIHMMGGTVAFEASTYVTRRFGIGGRAGGGVTIVPLLVDELEYNETILPLVGGAPQALHQGAKPTVIVGPTIEYYTKLSHFSVGADVDLLVILGLDVGAYPSGYLKYTF